MIQEVEMEQAAFDERKQKQINTIMVGVVVLSVGGMATAYLLQCEGGVCPSVEQFVRSFGVWAPLIFGLTYFAASPIPMVAPVLSAAGDSKYTFNKRVHSSNVMLNGFFSCIKCLPSFN